MYEARPLSDEDSQRLFFKRLCFSSEDIPQELTEVYHDILKKCGGLPLAIISIAGLLANRSRTKEVWVSTLKSISAAVDKDIDRMKRIFLLSYFDLQRCLKSCLLYLSVFPEDYLIDCQQLILLWVAEGLIPGQDRESMEHLGRSYLNELINRSLIQPTKIEADGATVKECRVHDVILDFIVSKAVEDNFVTIWNSNDVFSEKYSSNKIRRLSIQEDISSRAVKVAKTINNAAHIRSINIFVSNSVLLNKHASKFLSSQVLRVLNVQDYVDECSLGHVKSFGQMKYLRIHRKFQGCNCKLPENIEKLQHLETVDVRGTDIVKLPESIAQLQKLVRLVVDPSVQLPDGIGNLQTLEELPMIALAFQSVKIIQGLGDLTNLRVLGIGWSYDDTNIYPSKYNSPKVHDVKGHMKACISSLSKLLMSLRVLRLVGLRLPDATPSFMASCVCSPPKLRKLIFGNSSMVPHQISLLIHLTRLQIGLHSNISKEGINILASLPMLLSLTVYFVEDSGILHPRPSINSEGFPRLVKFSFYCWLNIGLEFEPEAMPKLQRLKLQLMARCQFKYGHGGMVLGLQNLAGLKHVALTTYCHAATVDEVQALEDDIKGAARTHPNDPAVEVERFGQYDMAQGCSRRPSDHPIQEVP